MKSIFTKLSTLLFAGVVALVGCTDFSADIREVNQKIDDLANSAATKTEVAALKAQIEALQAEIASQYATKEDVAAVSATIKTVQDAVEAAKADLVAALENKADKATVEAAIAELVAALETAETEFTAALENLASENETVKQSVADLLASVQTLQDDVKALQDDLAAVTGEVEALEVELNKVASDVEVLATELEELAVAFQDYKEKVDAELAAIAEQFKAIDDTIAGMAKSEDVAEEVEALAALVEEVNAILDEKVELLLSNDEDLAAKDEALAAKDEELAAAVAELEEAYAALAADAEGQFEEVAAQINEILNTVADNYEALAGRLAACEQAIEDLTGRVEDLENKVTALRSVVLVPETVYNGTKAVKFHRVEGENVLKTFAYVSFHFNPSNFDLASAEYEVMAENVEFMTKASAEVPAIEIVGEPVQEGDKVTFLFERAEGAGNMFALKVTLADGSVIYSEYAAILDEVNFVTANASVSLEVERLALEVPAITSLASLIETIKSVGTAIENYQAYIDAIQTAYEKAKAGNIYGAVEALGSVPGIIVKKQVVLVGEGSHTVQVETMTAETLFEDLMNASSISDLMAQLEALLGKAEGLGGEQGAQIVETLKNLANSNAELGDMTSILAGLEENLFSADAVRENAYVMLENSKGDLEQLKAKAAELHAELEALKAEGASAVAIGLKEAEVKIADAAVVAGEAVVGQWEDKLDDALAVVEGIREKIDQYTEDLFQSAKDYIAGSEVGQAIKDLENAIAEQGWEGKKMVAETDAKVVASAEAIKDLLAEYNALNQTVVDEYNDSIFGRLLSVILSQEAADAFAELGLTPLHDALKQLPEIATMIMKYYPAGMNTIEGATSLIGGLTPEVAVEWTTDYELAK